MRPPAFSFSRSLTVVRAAALAVAVSALALPLALQADVATKTGDKKKDPEDKKSRKDKFDYLPEARNVNANFLDGQPAEVELVAAVGSLNPMEFIIRQGPMNGALSVIQPHMRESNKALVTYIHHANAALTDSFTYACRLKGGAWSAPATVTLTGRRMEPKIEVVSLPNFGRVFLGGEIATKVVVRNSGAADYRTALKWPEPFVGPPEIAVPRGGTVEFQVFAKPNKPGEFRHELDLQPGVREARMVFFTVCVKALAVSPSRLTLTLDPKSGERTGVLSLANARPQSVRVVMKHPSRLLAPEETEVASGSRSDLRIALPPGDVEGFLGEIVVVAGDDVQNVTVDAKPKPAALQVLVPASLSLDFGIVDQRIATTREVVLSNAGGESLVLEARAQPPYSLSEPVTVVRLEPRGQSRLKVALRSERIGSTPAELELTSNGTRTVVALAADVREAAAVAVAPSTPVMVTVPSKPSVQSPATAPPKSSPTVGVDGVYPSRTHVQSVLLAVLASAGVPKRKSEIDPYLPVISSLEVVSTSRKDAVIAWPKPAVIPPGWTVEVAAQKMDPKTHVFVKLWSPYRDWETTEVDGNRVALRLKNLKPGSIYEVRVLAINREGKVSEPATAVMVQTALPWRMPPVVWSTLIALALGYAGYRLYRMRDSGFTFGQRGAHPTARPDDEAVEAALAAVQSAAPQAKV